MAKKPGSALHPLWYKDAIIYELHVRAFKDSNGDGIGDFPGLIQKMDYLVIALLSLTTQGRRLRHL
jgi:maltose alpha-D-glucosyltransferase/alpha-amylase